MTLKKAYLAIQARSENFAVRGSFLCQKIWNSGHSILNIFPRESKAHHSGKKNLCINPILSHIASNIR